MAEATALARRFRTEVDMGTVESPDWQLFPAIYEFVPKIEGVDQDDSDYDSDGWASANRTARKWSLEIKARHKLNPETQAENPVQAKVRLAGRSVGADATIRVRWYDRNGGPEAEQGEALVSWESDGGDQEQSDNVTVNLTGRGNLTSITNPVTASLPTAVVSALDPATGPAAGGTLVKITGSYFVGVSGAAAVKFGSTNATSYFVEDDTTIYAVAPAVAAGVVNVRVTNTTGQSPTGAGNAYTYV
ncbi:MAG: hypothetical protein HOQ43_10915 [Glycomyces artemisiae]|uniref:IPT/TIG domain-containing protein n=1 Tax=Glycomyces artemisiae TaxID=1076443 RepID=A0A850C7T3_9ACTN|nr:hypothetical protein [Glycomyces artemisiae]